MFVYPVYVCVPLTAYLFLGSFYDLFKEWKHANLIKN